MVYECASIRTLLPYYSITLSRNPLVTLIRFRICGGGYTPSHRHYYRHYANTGMDGKEKGIHILTD